MKSMKFWLLASIVASFGTCTAQTGVTSSGNPALVGQTVVFTVRIDPPTDIAATPTGSVIFVDNGMAIGTRPLQNAGATFATEFAAAGDHSVIAQYSGDQNFQPADSPPFVEHVTADDAFTISVMPSSLIQHSGDSSAVTVSLLGNGNMATPVHLSCDSLPPGTTCSFGTNTVTPSVSPSSTIMTISTTATRRAGVGSGHRSGVYAAAFLFPFLFGATFAGPFFSRQKKLALFAGLCVLAAAMLWLVGCSDALKVIHSGTPAGLYNVRVLGNDGTLIQVATVQLDVKN